MSQEKLTYNVDEVADLTGLNPRTVQRLAHEGKLPTVDFGIRKLFFPRREIERFIEQRTRSVGPQIEDDVDSRPKALRH